MNGEIALVSCAMAQERDEDLPVVAEALRRHGRAVSIRYWDDAAVDWSRFAAAIVRSPWDYWRRYDEFLGWVDRVSAATALLNTAAMLRWNTDKRYLGELAEAGIPVIPTTYVDEVTCLEGDAVLAGDVVVKPTVSAGSNDTTRHRNDPASARDAVRAVLALGKTAMVQPYQAAVDDAGETGLLYFNGEYSHAFCKAALLTGSVARNSLYAEEMITPREPTAAQKSLADAVMAHVTARFGELPLYARVDMLPAADGSPVLIELEMSEPSLFLFTSDGADDRFAAAVCARVQG